MSERIRGKVLHDWQEKGIILIRGDNKVTYFGHWDFEKRGMPKRGLKVYFYAGEPETLPDGTVAFYPTALDVKRFAELPENANRKYCVACPECGHKWFSEKGKAHFCPNCGAKLEQGEL